ncbi:hypothetical protein R6Q59_033294 [Mikania micrantha]
MMTDASNTSTMGMEKVLVLKPSSGSKLPNSLDVVPLVVTHAQLSKPGVVDLEKKSSSYSQS